GKYSAYYSIGSDENYDRYSQMSVFREDERAMQETKTEKIHLYTGSMFLDKDYLWQEGKEEIFLPAYKVAIAGIFLSIGNDGEMKQPQAAFIYQGKQITIPMRCIYYKGKTYDFEEGYGGCLYLIPEVVSSEGKFALKDMTVGLFITEKSMNALWVKLYLFNQEENFKLVHKEDNLFVEELRNQNVEVGDIILFQEVHGPIKIWKINYPSDTSFKPEYPDTKYPENISIAKDVF
ncbi:MAG: hypothetical protein AABX71_01960, partial [Nanoarchaeota archaeon]